MDKIKHTETADQSQQGLHAISSELAQFATKNGLAKQLLCRKRTHMTRLLLAGILTQIVDIINKLGGLSGKQVRSGRDRGGSG